MCSHIWQVKLQKNCYHLRLQMTIFHFQESALRIYLSKITPKLPAWLSGCQS